MQRTTPVKSFMKESALWTLANALGVGVPIVTIYIGLHVLLGVSMTKVSLAMSAGALLTLTWGSWGSLVWAKNRLLRASMQLMTIVPGILLLVFAGLGFYVGKGSLLFWLGLLTTGVGTIAASFMLARSVGTMSVDDSPTSLLAGFGIFPMLTTGAAGGVSYLWYLFVSNPLQTDWRSMFSLSVFFVTTLAIVLISTVVPAVITLFCRRMSASR